MRSFILIYLLLSTLIAIIAVPIWGLMVAMSSMVSDSGSSNKAILVMLALTLLPIILIFGTVKSWLNYVRKHYRTALFWSVPGTVISSLGFMLLHGDFLTGSYTIAIVCGLWLICSVWLARCVDRGMI